ncbi:putative 40S ribosomal protein S10-like [Apostichopus japonicus]|uniref:Putative 40S ribosomal protein S10-like n=1 Tax=Stichopus japonicus TaxID=307972 RepID=A0A2G8KKS8_STIJA|nr:putative 40S ribosomal protein S10-like [Apostichopus japonicus]
MRTSLKGVMVAKKDTNLAKHPEVDVPNLHVMKALQRLRQGAVCLAPLLLYLTNEGIQYLRETLNLPPEIVPTTLKRQARPETTRPRPKGQGMDRGPSGPVDSQRDSYRRGTPGGPDKKGEAGAGSTDNFEFKGGFYGRGRGAPQ